MRQYNIHDTKILSVLRQEGIECVRDNHSWFDVDLELEQGETYELKSGVILVCRGSRLYIKNERDEYISKMPGRYFDQYAIKDQAVVEAFQRNGYSIELLYPCVYEINAYIPIEKHLVTELILSDKTKIVVKDSVLELSR